jgi:signal transduction histidine kinase
VHDLNNPLTAILGNVQLLEMKLQNALSADQKNSFYLILYSIHEMINMISNLLDIGKMEEGKINLRYEEINLGVVFKEIIDVMKILAQQEGKVISVRMPSDIKGLYADREILKRVVTNLIGNALKFTPPGAVIEIAAHYNKDVKEVVISVKDEGQGIPKEDLNRVFDKFVQVESAQVIEKTGKGLGLNFCKMAVEAHEGRIWVESEGGKGSTFYFTFPIKE